jgi:serine/threonine protein kinase/Tfp pilus assembly protein PilF
MECPKCHFENQDDSNFCAKCATKLPSADEVSASRTKTYEVFPQEFTRGSILAGRYEIIEDLGRGGMGKVYKVFDKDINEKVALKLIRPEIASNEKTIERFRNELKMARKISHRNVCRMFDLGKDKEHQYITMEYVDGEDLKKFIRMMGPLTAGKAVFIAKQVCEGLAEAHRLGIVHRDLKPHNIMIDRDGNARIMDFGIALSQEGKGITDSRVTIGTPQYMSPEQVEGKKADQRSDLYSLGVMLFEMTTGKVPFDGDTTLSIALKHKIEAPRDPKEFNAQIPEALSRLILKCMEKDPKKRYQSAEELCAELIKIEEELPTEARVLSRIKLWFGTSRKRLQFSRILRILFIMTLILIAGYFFYDQILKKTGEMKWENSIIVLPFKDLSPSKDQEPLCLGVTDAIIRNLHAFPELRVIGLTTALTYQDSNKGVKEIGEECKVTNILEGTILTEMDHIFMTTQLSSADDGSVIWTFSDKKQRKGVLELQDEISKSIAKTLGVRLVEKRYATIKRKVPTNLKANEYYQYGLHFEMRYYESKEKKDFENCVKNYLEAVKTDPNHALAYWRLGNVYYIWYIEEDDEKVLDLTYGYFQKAYEIDPDLAEVNAGLGWVYFNKEDNDRAYQYFKRAYEIDPNNAEINFHIGSFLRSIGLYEQAINHYSRAFEFDPIPSDFCMWQDVRARCYSYMGKFEEAADYMKNALEIKPDHYLHLNYARQLINMKKYEDAEIQILKAKEIAPDSSFVKHHLAWILAAKGEKKRALELIKDTVHTFHYRITNIYSLLGMKDEAIKNINEGIDRGFEEVKSYLYSYPYLENNPGYDNLRDDPRFQELLKNEKEKYEAKLKKYGDL